MARRMNLLNIEKNIQNLWKEHNVYEKEFIDNNESRFTGNFPYPYMNGLLHIGHAFTLSKLEFLIRYKNMTCQNVLLPFAFHCTGTPIVVCADKLKNELKGKVLGKSSEGNKSDITNDKNELDANLLATTKLEQEPEKKKQTDATVFRSNKSKQQSKGSKQNTQYEIMKQMDISDEEIHHFQKPQYWCYYFSSKAKEHLSSLGLFCDWRRSFITTNMNPYYDKFVNWHFNSLYKKNLIYYGSRITIFSRVNNQACADHERSEGEGVKCQEFTLIKIYVHDYKEFYEIYLRNKKLNEKDSLKNENVNENFFSQKKIILLASTLKPETAYGQNYTFVNPGEYYYVTLGFNKQRLHYGDKNYVNNVMTRDEIIDSCENVYICSENSLYNLAYQGVIPMLSKGSCGSSKATGQSSDHCTDSLNSHSGKGTRGTEDTLSPFSDLLILMKIKGEELVGLRTYSNLSEKKDLYILPMTTIKMNIATAIVPCVSSDSADDYACLQDIRRKQAYYCEKYNLKDEFLHNESFSCIQLPDIGDNTGKYFYEMEKISSYKDAKLQKVKETLYKKQYFEGTMTVEPYKGMKIYNCRKLVKQYIIKNNEGFLYSEPEVLVMDRNNAKCIAALCNQWYINYGNLDFKKEVLIQMKKNNFQTYNEVLHKQLQHVIFWLDDWSCSRAYGLGTQMPDFNALQQGGEGQEGTMSQGSSTAKMQAEGMVGDAKEGSDIITKLRSEGEGMTQPGADSGKELIESLSDSTIYMAYYTISHFLQGNVDGSVRGLLDIDAADLNDAFFDYVFDISDDTEKISKNISVDKLQRMRREFQYWYPFDVRISGKDLIFNHLTMALFNHVAIWGDKIYNNKQKETNDEKSILERQGEILNEIDQLDLDAHKTIKYFPKSFFCNGHVLVNKEKMSKSKGNFITLKESINQYTSDGTRIALADAGDSIEDANFNTDTANSAIMKLYNLINFSIETKNNVYIFRCGEKTFIDSIFENEINYLTNKCKESYEKLLFRDVLKYGFYDMLLKRDTYRIMCDKIHMHKETVNFFIERICLIIHPLIPHVTEHIWTYILKKEDFLVNQKWPSSDDTSYSIVMHKQYNNLLNVVEIFRKSYDKVINKNNKQKGVKGTTSANAAGSGAKRAPDETGTPDEQKDIDNKEDDDEGTKFKAIVYVAKEYNDTQKRIIEILNRIINNSEDKKLPTNYINLLVQNDYVNKLPKNEKKEILSFATFLVKDNVTLNNNQYELSLPYDEIQLIKNNVEFIRRSLNLGDIHIMENTNKSHIDDTDIYKLANPGNPSIFMYTTES
ncbi:leucine--tRNA ligase, putative [Plasmodium knowlesi strain H]|uniref:leucine--tRNA ligase n=3 Tax=Plasmodium knowlesi TaxID=5850 RepID=A0A5K1UYU6_PLAKH|nr:leucine--tRNA ligase, putative [Plasmodium knowlesi strain H]OTN64798.1 putative Leucine--tRNA ligase [Plasmodium knowlesi]CAA9989102.1 leucine--tRNA ligase, putative [Plasmodium knowlesi strain H]SBO27317.1 leucine--tRNA ligase, putative [Plasmodium knowlesi strain H]SBO28941.1 leucine--tRNA ligase, putative [Plasmodium knowlesi strain H]VVS78576.1 leucine--tRNA ligase, putative [Plasmodium knowlesi strain H]|eukprot:XP_002261449.1 leucyl-trna synthetase, cytoplasmic, putative [Plasmodium knowlesi strain H]